MTFDALVGQTLRGTVGEIPLQGALQGGVMVYQVPIVLPGADKLPLLVGMTANVQDPGRLGAERAAGAGHGHPAGQQRLQP